MPVARPSDVALSTLIDELQHRAAGAWLNLQAPRHDALRAELLRLLTRSPGEADALFASPVFQARFGFKSAPETMKQLADSGFLHPDLVRAMDDPPEGLTEQRFGADWRPFTHQREAWNHLNAADARSVVVSSGTGSGKTECFLVPILDRLARERRPVVGVRALMLYPLNALINSQRERLSAWTRPFKGRIRYCLYNGETPETHRADNRRPEQVLDRATLRKSPPPILVTNATMLEYMLVRPQDRPIIDGSKGMLETIVLDEAHTYIGSAAAELSLLLRRVVSAFEVDPDQVRFVATSATIASKSKDEARESLATFLGDIAGQAKGRVRVVFGESEVPSLPAPAAEGLTEEARGLLKNGTAKALRKLLVGQPHTLAELQTKLKQPKDEILRLLEAGHQTALPGAQCGTFLPLRAHLYQRSQGSVWACANPQCKGLSSTKLAGTDWPFGPVYLDWQANCPSCEGRCYELKLCSNCGSSFLHAQRVNTPEGEEELQAIPPSYVSDFDGLTDDDNDDDSSDEELDLDRAPVQTKKCLIGPMVWTKELEAVQSGSIDPQSGLRTDEPRSLHFFDEEEHCPCCRVAPARGRSPFRSTRTGSAFAMRTSLPCLLEAMPATDEAHLPFGGRRLITFTDSRQGTARLATTLLRESERNYVRGHMYHQVWSSSRVDPDELREAKEEVQQRRTTIESVPEAARAAMNDWLNEAVEKLEALQRPASVPVRDVIDKLQDTAALRQIHAQRREYAVFDRDEGALARLLVLRELAYRPRRYTSLENMGLLALSFPEIDSITKVPAAWKALKGSLQDWKDYLTLIAQFFIRDSKAISVHRDDYRWMGMERSPGFITAPDEEPGHRSTFRWLRWRGAAPSRKRELRLLVRAFDLDVTDPSTRGDVNDVLDATWTWFRRRLERAEDGYQLDLEKSAHLRVVSKAWWCPVTRRVLDTTLRGYTPYLAASPNLADKAIPIEMPAPLAIWGEDRLTGQTRSIEDIRSWLRTDDKVEKARKTGFWSELTDRIVESAAFFVASEHSAQLDSKRLQRTESRFKKGTVNVLSCSTTMEMGVDIGGVRGVAMGNVPPHPANYLQRTGRAGRRGETLALALTVCKNLPHDLSVFHNPRWPFTTPIHVSAVRLDSRRIVQRHVAALALRTFLAAIWRDADASKLNCAWFFAEAEGVASPAGRFVRWLKESGRSKGPFEDSFAAMTRGTALDGVQPVVVNEAIAERVEEVATAWRTEREGLEQQKRDQPVGAAGEPARRSIDFQIKRHEGEYLLGYLANVQVLPGSGLPTGVLPFVTLTAEELQAEQRGRGGRQFQRSTRRAFPTRDLPIAIRDYAPGNEVVLDGRVYRSSGVTLNWQLPPDGGEQAVREVQAFQHLRRCRDCGHWWTAQTHRGPRCPACNGDRISRETGLLPGGFAVDIRDRAGLDTLATKYVPVEPPRVSAGHAPLVALGRPVALRFRYSPEGRVFHLSRGEHRLGYALCLRCGRAAARTSAEQTAVGLLADHRPLRGGKQVRGADGYCVGAQENWALKDLHFLGGEIRSDVLELQFSELGEHSERVPWTLAVALRDALCAKLGVETSEVGFHVADRREPGGVRTPAIFLFDTAPGGAGFVGEARQDLIGILRDARSRLVCTADCRDACSHCLLSFGTQHHRQYLHRHEALAFLTSDRLAAMDLPQSHRRFGPDTMVEWDTPWNGLLRELNRQVATSLHLYAGDDPSVWDPAGWPHWSELLRLAEREVAVTWVVKPGVLDSLDDSVRNAFARLCGVTKTRVVFANAERTLGDQTLWAVATLLDGRQVAAAVSESDAVHIAPGWLEQGTDSLPVIALGTDLVELPDAESKAGAELEVQLPAGVVVVALDQRLEGKVSDLGAGLLSVAPELSQAITKHGPIATLRYEDRYLRSPLSVAALYAVLSVFKRRGWLDGDSEVELLTSAAGGKVGRYPSSPGHDWPDTPSQKDVIEGLLRALGVRLKVEVSQDRMSTLPHLRGMFFTLEDGSSWLLHLEQGFGFLELHRQNRRARFDFGRNTLDQVNELMLNRWHVVRTGNRDSVAYWRRLDQ